MNTLDEIFTARPPTPERPLLGQTVLVVEDSRYACEALRLLCLKSGARIRRAGNLMQARRHLTTYRPNVIIVDLGLPDGSGTDLISDLARSIPRVEVLLGSSGDPGAGERAINAGADAFLPKPVSSLAEFQQTILALLPDDRIPHGLRVLPSEQIRPDELALRDDLSHVADLLHPGCQQDTLRYITQFVHGIALSINDSSLAAANRNLAENCLSGQAIRPAIAKLATAVQDTLARTPQGL